VTNNIHLVFPAPPPSSLPPSSCPILLVSFCVARMEYPKYETVAVERLPSNPAVLHVKLNRPKKLNGMNAQQASPFVLPSSPFFIFPCLACGENVVSCSVDSVTQRTRKITRPSWVIEEGLFGEFLDREEKGERLQKIIEAELDALISNEHGDDTLDHLLGCSQGVVSLPLLLSEMSDTRSFALENLQLGESHDGLGIGSHPALPAVLLPTGTAAWRGLLPASSSHPGLPCCRYL